MQPHSMCVVALVGFLWNQHDPVKVSKCGMRVEFRKQGDYISYFYDLTNIQESSDQRELKVSIMRGGGGLSCTVNARRSSTSEGSEVTMTHENNHLSGLREVYNLYKLRVANGMHYNSGKYKAFSGEFQTLDYKVLNLDCEIKTNDDSFTRVPYKLERTDLILA